MIINARPARRAEVNELAAVLGRAFFDDPLMVWLLPEARARARGLPRMFGTLTRHHFLPHGVSEVVGKDIGKDVVSAAALWDPPGARRQSRLQELRTMPSFVRALGSRLVAARQLSELMKRHRPTEPHWYLAVIGSDPSVRGSGFGHALMRSTLDTVDAEHAPAYLEATSLANVAYYQRFGFEVTGEVTVPGGGPTIWPVGGPTIWPMWRPGR